MSTHILDVSGQRALTVTLNDPARTAAQSSAKAGDDVAVLVGGAREVRLALPPGAKIQRRKYIRKTPKKDGDVFVKDEANEYVYDEVPYEELVLVVPGSLTLFGRTSIRDEEKGVEGTPTYESTPHTSVVAKRMVELHQTEKGELLEERDLREFLPALDADTLAKIDGPAKP